MYFLVRFYRSCLLLVLFFNSALGLALQPPEREIVPNLDSHLQILGEYGAPSNEALRIQLVRKDRESVAANHYVIQYKIPAVFSSTVKSSQDRTVAYESIKKVHSQLTENIAVLRKQFPETSIEVCHRYSWSFAGTTVKTSPEIIEKLKDNGIVDEIFPDFQVTSQLHRSSGQIGAVAARQRFGLTGKDVVVAIVDSGVDYQHPGLGGGFGGNFKVLGGHDFFNHDADPMDDFGHGTHVAGIIAANGTLSGVAPDARLLAYKVLDSTGVGRASDVVAAIERCIDPDNDPDTDDSVDIANFSLGGVGFPTDFLCRAVNAATAAGVLCVVAAGNDGRWGSIRSPALAQSAIAVGAVSEEDELADFNSRGPARSNHFVKPEIYAPGLFILSLQRGGGNTLKSGTSMAAGHISGAAAILRQLHPEWRPEQLRGCLLGSAWDIGESPMLQGAGRVDLLAACQSSLLIEGDLLSIGQNLGADNATWKIEKQLKLTNLSTTDLTLTAVADEDKIPKGIRIELVPESLTIQSGQTKDIDFVLNVDNKKIPMRDSSPYEYSGEILLRSEASTYSLPWAFTHELRDSFEPNNSATQAALIEIDSSPRLIRRGGQTRIDENEYGSSCPDEDWFKFSGKRGQIISATVESSWYSSPLRARISLFDRDMNRLNPSVSNRLAFIKLPDDGFYYLQVKATTILPNDVGVGSYWLFANSLPSDVKLIWTPDSINYRNKVDSIGFNNFGNYVHSSRWYNFLTLSPMDGTKTPEYHITRGVKSFSVPLGVGGSDDINYHEKKFSDFLNGYLATGSESDLSVTTYRHDRLRETTKYLHDSRAWETITVENDSDWDYFDGPAVAAGESLFVFGGRTDLEGMINRGWRWNGTKWDSIKMKGDVPSPRRDAVMAFDSANKTFLLFGGESGYMQFHGDLFEFDGETWKSITPQDGVRPPPSCRGGFVYDPERQVAVLCCGNSQNTWEYSPSTKKWAAKAQPPFPLWTRAMCYDPVRKKVLMVTHRPEDLKAFAVWAWSGSEWSRLADPDFPEGATNTVDPKITYDAARNRVVVYSFLDATERRGDQWELNGDSWERIELQKSAPFAVQDRVVFDPISQHLLQFAGVTFAPRTENPHRMEVRKTKKPTPIAEHFFAGGKQASQQIRGLVVSPDGSRIITSVSDAIQVRDSTGNICKSIAWPSPVDIIQTDRTGRLAVISEIDKWGNPQAVVDLESNNVIYQSSSMSQLRLSPNGNWLTQADGLTVEDRQIIGDRHRAVYLFERTSEGFEKLWRFDPGPNQAIRLAEVSDDGAEVFAGGCRLRGPRKEQGVISFLIDGRTGQERYRYYQAEDAAIIGSNQLIGVSLNASGTLAAVATMGRDGRYGQLTAFSPQSAAPLMELSVPGDVTCFAATGNSLAVGTVRSLDELALGGETIGVDLSQRLVSIPPLVSDIQIGPKYCTPGTPVSITCKIHSKSTGSQVIAQVEGPDEFSWQDIELFDDGEHDDESAGDGIYGCTWITSNSPRDYIVDILATSAQGITATHSNAVGFSTRPNAFLSIEAILLEGGSTSLKTGKNRFTLRISNHGLLPAKDIAVTVAANSLYVSDTTDIYTNQTVLAKIDPGQVVTTSADFYIDVEPSIPIGHRIELQVELETQNGLWSDIRRFPPFLGNSDAN